MMSQEYMKTKAINTPKEEIWDLEESDKIKLGEQSKVRRDYQQSRLNRNHEKAMSETTIGQKNYGSNRVIKAHHKEHADPFPHKCRYYKGCDEQVEHSNQNKPHFDRFHPLTHEEEHLYATVYTSQEVEQYPGSKRIHELSILFGRSEDTIKNILFKNGILNMSRWAKRDKEIKEFHEYISNNRNSIVYLYKKLAESAKEPDPILDYYPTDVSTIQNQDYISGQSNTIIEDQIQTIIKSTEDLLVQHHELRKWKLDAEIKIAEQSQQIATLQGYVSRLQHLTSGFVDEYNSLYIFPLPETDDPPLLI